MKIVTGKSGTPHVTSQEFRQFVEGTVGQESYILASGENLEPELSSNNLLKIRSGMMCHHGNISCVELGTYDEVALQNGNQGMKRIDLVVNRYSKKNETGIEESDWVVIQGTPSEDSPTAPGYTEGNVQEGDLVDDCPVFEVHFDGINVTEVKKLLSVTPDMSTLNADLSELCSVVEYDITDLHLKSAWEVRYADVHKIGRLVIMHMRIFASTIVKNHEYEISNTIDANLIPSSNTPLCAVAGNTYMQDTVACQCTLVTEGIIKIVVPGDWKQYVDIFGTYITE